MIVSIILPVYNGEFYLEKLIKNIREQVTEFSVEIIAAVSPSKDNSFELSKKMCDKVFYEEDFNHAVTRHRAALMAEGEIIVFITQDILPYDKYWLQNLVSPLNIKSKIVATFSKQVAYEDSTYTEKLIRDFNYPTESRLCSADTRAIWGRKNIFYSDASSATIKEVFLKLGGYNFHIETNEDVIYALNVIENGYKIYYNAESKVYHSHDFKMKLAYNRYKLIGIFEKKYEHKLKDYATIGEGKKLLKYLIFNLVKKRKLKELIILNVDLLTRFIGYKSGYKS